MESILVQGKYLKEKSQLILNKLQFIMQARVLAVRSGPVGLVVMNTGFGLAIAADKVAYTIPLDTNKALAARSPVNVVDSSLIKLIKRFKIIIKFPRLIALFPTARGSSHVRS